MLLTSAVHRSVKAIGILDSLFPLALYRDPASIDRLWAHPRGVTVIRRGRRKVVRVADKNQLPAYAMGQRLRELRLKRGMRQDDVAERCGIARPNIARIEQGKHMPSIKTIRRLSDVFDISPATFLESPHVVLSREDRMLAESGLTSWTDALDLEDRLVR